MSKQHKPDFQAALGILMINPSCPGWQPTESAEKARKLHMQVEAEVELQRMFYVTLGGEEWAEKMIADSREWLKRRHAEIDAELAAATGGAS